MRLKKHAIALAAGAFVLTLTGAVAIDTVKDIELTPTPLAQKAGLGGSSGTAKVDAEKGKVEIRVENATVPQGSVLEGWVVALPPTASNADSKSGPPFGDENIARLSESIPYALSTGTLKKSGNSYKGKFQIDNSLAPYNAVVVTLESDGNRGNYDPRPGTPVLMGKIAGDAMTRDGMKKDEMKKDGMDKMDKDAMEKDDGK